MNKEQILNQILPILYTVKEDKEKLQKILDFLMEEIYEEPTDEVVIPEKYKKLVLLLLIFNLIASQMPLPQIIQAILFLCF